MTRRILGRSSGRAGSEAVVLFAESVFVQVACFLCGPFGVVNVQSGGIPVFHCDHRVIVGGKGFFGADCVDPGIDGLPVVMQQLVEVYVFHLRES
jgi:hypothetical protein